MTTSTINNKKSLLLPSIICILAAMFYLYEFILQVSPSVITHELMRDLGIDAVGLGIMSAFYYYAYTPMQLPAGLLYDRFGPRKVLTFAVLVCAVGAYFFSHTNTFGLACAGRFLMGVGSAFSFIGALVLVSRWFPPQYFAFLAGIVQLMSSIGAIAGQVPIASAVATWGWRSTTSAVAFFGIFLALLTWLIVRDAPKGMVVQHPESRGEWKRLLGVCASSQTWLVAAYSFLIWAPIVTFAALWGVPFMVSAFGITTHQASAACAMIWMGIGVGSPLIGWWSDHMHRRCMPLTLCGVIGVISVTLIIYMPGINLIELHVLLFLFGLAVSGQSLAFGVVKDNNPPNQAGTAIGFNNMATVAGGALFQPLAGFILKGHWDGVMHDGVPIYSVNDYRLALIVLPVCFILTIIISAFWLKETHCKHTYE